MSRSTARCSEQRSRRRPGAVKRFIAAGLALCSLTLPAMAADIGVPFVAPMPVPVVPWTGLYGGINFGWAASNTALAVTATDTGPAGLGSMVAARAIPGTMRGIHGGFIGGMQAGFNWQFAPAWVVGVETDFDWLANSDPKSVFPYLGTAAFPALNTTFVRGLDSLGTVRARFGWLFTPLFLFYATGGIAYGETRSRHHVLLPDMHALGGAFHDLIGDGNRLDGRRRARMAVRAGMERKGRIPLGRSRQPQRNHQLPLRHVQQHAYEQRPRARRHRAHGADVPVLVSGGLSARQTELRPQNHPRHLNQTSGMSALSTITASPKG